MKLKIILTQHQRMKFSHQKLNKSSKIKNTTIFCRKLRTTSLNTRRLYSKEKGFNRKTNQVKIQYLKSVLRKFSWFIRFLNSFGFRSRTAAIELLCSW